MRILLFQYTSVNTDGWPDLFPFENPSKSRGLLASVQLGEPSLRIAL